MLTGVRPILLSLYLAATPLAQAEVLANVPFEKYATCEQEYQAKGCDQFKAGLPAEDQKKVIDCARPESAAWVPVSCAKGAVMMAVHAVQGVISLPAAMAALSKEAGLCQADIARRRAYVAPLEPFIDKKQADILVNAPGLSCEKLLDIVHGHLERKIAEIKQRQLRQQEYERVANLSDLSERQRAINERRHPLQFRKPLTDAERALITSREKQSENVGRFWEDAYKGVKQRLGCYTASAQAEAVCEVGASILAPMAVARWVGGAGKVNRELSLIREELRKKHPGLPGRAAERAPFTAEVRAAPDYVNTVRRAEEKLGRTLTPDERDAVYRAHTIGRGEPGVDGSDAVKGNYTREQLDRKVRELDQAGIKAEERAKLMRGADAVVGDERKLALTGDPAVDRFREAFNYAPENYGLLPKADRYISFEHPESGRRMAGRAQVRSYGDGGLDVEYRTEEGLKTIRLSAKDVERVRYSDNARLDFMPREVPVEVQSLRGNTYTGSFEGAVYRKVEGSEKPVLHYRLRQADGTVHDLRADRLDMKTFSTAYDRGLDRVASPEQYPNSNGYWRQWGNTGAVPDQGWKLHVGAKPKHADAIAREILPELRRLKIPHKVVEDYTTFARLPAADTQHGKLITIYPRNKDEAREIARVLDEHLRRRGFAADQFEPIKGETQAGLGVYARFGKFRGNDDIALPDGRIVQDVRGRSRPTGIKPFFSEPQP